MKRRRGRRSGDLAKNSRTRSGSSGRTLTGNRTRRHFGTLEEAMEQ